MIVIDFTRGARERVTFRSCEGRIAEICDPLRLGAKPLAMIVPYRCDARSGFFTTGSSGFLRRNQHVCRCEMVSWFIGFSKVSFGGLVAEWVCKH